MKSTELNCAPIDGTVISRLAATRNVLVSTAANVSRN